MLVISRRKGQRITIGDDIELVVTELHRSSVKLGIEAPRGYAVLRGEVRDSIETANRAAAETALDSSLGLDNVPAAAATRAKKPSSLLGTRQAGGGQARQEEDTKADPEVVVRRRRRVTPEDRTHKPSDSEPAEVV